MTYSIATLSLAEGPVGDPGIDGAPGPPGDMGPIGFPGRSGLPGAPSLHPGNAPN